MKAIELSCKPTAQAKMKGYLINSKTKKIRSIEIEDMRDGDRVQVAGDKFGVYRVGINIFLSEGAALASLNRDQPRTDYLIGTDRNHWTDEHYRDAADRLKLSVYLYPTEEWQVRLDRSTPNTSNVTASGATLSEALRCLADWIDGVEQ